MNSDLEALVALEPGKKLWIVQTCRPIRVKRGCPLEVLASSSRTESRVRRLRRRAVSVALLTRGVVRHPVRTRVYRLVRCPAFVTALRTRGYRLRRLPVDAARGSRRQRAHQLRLRTEFVGRSSRLLRSRRRMEPSKEDLKYRGSPRSHCVFAVWWDTKGY